MSLDATEVKLTRYGAVHMGYDGTVLLTGFKGSDGSSCRDVATLALIWAIGRLQEELMLQVRKPGGSGNVCLD